MLNLFVKRLSWELNRWTAIRMCLDKLWVLDLPTSVTGALELKALGMYAKRHGLTDLSLNTIAHRCRVDFVKIAT
jgi:hypothetical protein